MTLNRDRVKRHLKNCDLQPLFIEELGWDHGGSDIAVADETYALEAIAHKRGMVAYQYVADSARALPDYPTRQKIERDVGKTVREHLIIYADAGAQYWHWVKREPGWPDRSRHHIYRQGQAGESLIQKLEQIAFTLEEEEDLTLVDVTSRVRAAFDVEKVTKRFYDRFKKEHSAFLTFIEGIENTTDREWYASLMLNRMMFIYFIQKRGFLDGNPDYLRDRLERVRQQQGEGNFLGFHRLFLLRLFHEGLGQPEAARAPELAALLGKVPYLNGGLFEVHDLERDNPKIHIPDEAFEQIFAFFDAYQWHLDDRLLRNDNEINPDVLGYIFEKYINQKQMGAYYTKEDITGYISRNTIIPFLFDRAKKACAIAFSPEGWVWRLLSDDPDRYFHEAVRHGITYDMDNNAELAEKRDLPNEIAAGLDDVAKRDGWNQAAPPEYALPTETWREHIARRQRYEDIHAKLAAGEIASINDLITYNLDIEKFAQDVLASSEGPELIRAFWKAINAVSVLDPTCGSGAFLFAALDILEPLYVACLEAMRGFLDDLERSHHKHPPEKLRDFRQVLQRVAEHASERYFILKSIIIDNLYGVDIMEEAVEICKLRLFLKLVAQLATYEQIEPLPDIDFNIRAGNTLVGFTSLAQVKEALSSDLIKRLSLPQIEERAEIADRAFRQFRTMQTQHGLDASAFTSAKSQLRKRLTDLRDELDEYLAGEYDVKPSDGTAYQCWRDRHQPFHWFVEFYGIMHRGGFDVIIGNPPYVEYSKVKKEGYTVKGYETESCGNLYAMTWERSIRITSRGRIGLIVPASAVCTDGYAPLRNLMLDVGDVVVSSYSDNPGKLFSGMPHNRLQIILLDKGSKKRQIYSTVYNKWRPNARSHLFENLIFLNSTALRSNFGIAKISHSIETSILAKFNAVPLVSHQLKTIFRKNFLYYTRKLSHFVQILNFIPKIYDSYGNLRRPSELKEIRFDSQVTSDGALALLNSSLFFWLVTVFSDCRNLNQREVQMIRFDLTDKDRLECLAVLAQELMSDIKANSELKKQGQLTIQQTFPRMSKFIIDEIDKTLAPHYGFTDEELDYLINYDIKYRMGR